MLVNGLLYVPVNLLFLSLGVLMYLFAGHRGIALPTSGDEVMPYLCAGGYLGQGALAFFTLGIVAAALSSADSALTALTTSYCVDILRKDDDVSVRHWVHLGMMAAFLICTLLFDALDGGSVMDLIYTLVSYTYGPLLGLFAFGLLTRRVPRGRWVPYVAVAAPIICFTVDYWSMKLYGYKFGYELLMFNGLLAFGGLYLISSTVRK